MLIRKNTKAFKTILEIFTACQGRGDREQLIRLFITKAGSTVKDRISVDAIQGDAALFYEMNYQTVLNSLRSSNHQLNESDDIPGLFYFHSTSNKSWDETPFEFDEAITKEFNHLPDLPKVRKKEKVEKFVLPAPRSNTGSPKKAPKAAPAKAPKGAVRGPKQPDFKLKHEIEFTDLDRIIFRQPLLNKEKILTYYNDLADLILPYLNDRGQWVRTSPDRSRSLVQLTTASLFANDEESIPQWLRSRTSKDGGSAHLLANDKEHLLLFVERGALEFHPTHSRKKQTEHPDYMIITVDSPDSDISKAVDVARVAKTILDGLKLPSFVKTNGTSQLDIYIPLDAKGNFKDSQASAKYLCNLINLKIPGEVALVGTDENTYGKVSLDYSLNEQGQTIIAPYSLVVGESVTVATPLRWDEVNDTLQPDAFSPESIVKRIKNVGDPFENLYKKKVNASDLKERLEANYAFLFD
ncbi:MAG TPA: hypothetical protein VGD65_00190 [Chryseosolibacter sp.]